MELVLDEVKLAERIPEFAVMENQEEVQELQQQLEEWFTLHPGVVGVALNQLGSDKRIIALLVKEDPVEVLCLCNPMIIKQRGLHVGLEKDLSLLDREFLVARHDEIVVDYQTIYGVSEERTLTQARGGDLVQQLIQRLDGVSIADFGLEVHEDFHEASEEDQQEVIQYYLDQLQNQQQALQENIDSDEETKKMQDAITFITKAAAGEIELQMPERVMPKVGRKERRRLKRKGLLDSLVDPITNRYRDLSARGKIK